MCTQERGRGKKIAHAYNFILKERALLQNGKERIKFPKKHKNSQNYRHKTAIPACALLC
jgi:hypothetical protein